MICDRGPMHPGGENLTRRAARLAGITPGMTVLDIGCGDGASVRLLEREFGANASGIDISGAFGMCGNALTAPLGNDLGAALFECTLSVIGDAPLMLPRVYAALRPGGWLILSDVYAKKPGTGLWTMEELAELITAAGFEIAVCEDHTPALVTWAAEHKQPGGAGYGYVLFIAGKPE